MAEFLSQDEIDALLNIAEEGEEDLDKVATGPKVPKEKSYTIYDFKKPNTITSEQNKAFEALHEKLVRTLVTELSSMMRKIVEIKVSSIEQMTYGEFILSIPPITSINTLSIKPLDGRIVVETNPGIGHKIIAELLGNGPSFVATNSDKELTDIELEVLGHFYKLLYSTMHEIWDEVATINFTVQTQDTNANAIQVISNHEIVLLVVLEIIIDDEIGNVSICYPVAYIEPLLNKIVEKLLGAGGKKKTSKKKDLNTLIQGARMEVEAVLAETQLTILELLNLKKDDVIIFNKNATSSSAKVYINKKEKFASVAGISNNRKAVQIQTNVDHEKMETLENLKILREEREENERIQKEKIARLLETKNEYI
jgi:flagellar motor switch protein FliM